jgi:hypothetical protein
MPEIPEPQKPIPQYTIRWMLAMTTVCAIVCSIVALAMQGHYWAFGVSVAIVSLVLFMLVGAMLFTVVWICSAIGSARDVKSTSIQSSFVHNDSNPIPNSSADGEWTS